MNLYRITVNIDGELHRMKTNAETEQEARSDVVFRFNIRGHLTVTVVKTELLEMAA